MNNVLCPSCNGTGTHSSKRISYFCGDCKIWFEAPATDVGKPVANKSIRVFLSYGQYSSSGQLVARISQDLKREEIDVWVDSEKIRFGDDWRQSITAIRPYACGMDRAVRFWRSPHRPGCGAKNSRLRGQIQDSASPVPFLSTTFGPNRPKLLLPLPIHREIGGHFGRGTHRVLLRHRLKLRRSFRPPHAVAVSDARRAASTCAA